MLVMQKTDIRQTAIEVLDRIFNHGAKADELLGRMADSIADVRDKALLHELVYGVLRRYFTLEADVSRFLKQKPQEAARLGLLLGTYQVRYMRIPVHAAVGETVGAVKALHAASTGLVNAVLRKVGESEPPSKFKPHQRAELPNWLYASWRDAFGAEVVQEMAALLQEKPSLCVAVFVDRDGWMQRAADAGFTVQAGELAEAAVILESGSDVTQLPGYTQGEFIVMDQAAQVAALSLDASPNELVLDLCAAPGGKTALLARRHPESEIIAVEQSEARIGRLKENLARVQAGNVTVVQGDATALAYEDASVDAILLDAPCTASGVIRRLPDAKFLHSPESVARHAELQKKMVAEALRVLKPAGRLVYAVCSIHPDENERVVESFAGLRNMQHLLPGEANDGFFIASFVKEAV